MKVWKQIICLIGCLFLCNIIALQIIAASKTSGMDKEEIGDYYLDDFWELREVKLPKEIKASQWKIRRMEILSLWEKSGLWQEFL